MKKCILIVSVAMLMTNISASYADCGENQKTCGKACIAADAVCYTCGPKCNAYYTGEGNNKTLNITGTGDMNNYEFEQTNGYHSTNTPWVNDSFKNVVIENGITSIGRSAFTGFGIVSVTIPETVKKIENMAFCNNKLTSVNIPDAVSSIGQSAFHTNNLTSVVLPDSLALIKSWAFAVNKNLVSVIIPDSVTNEMTFSGIFSGDQTLLNELNIICRGDMDKCRNFAKNYRINDNYDTIDLSGRVIAADYQYCNSTNYFWNGDSCVREPDVSKRKCCSSCKDMGGWCNRVRYTPAEAVKVLRDDNTNEVTITFKK